MSVYYVIFAGTADSDVLSSSGTYSTARAGTGATSNTATTATFGQSLNAGTYNCYQIFERFDTSAVAAGNGTGIIGFNCTSGSGNTSTYEVRETSSLANKIAGASISGNTLYGSGNITNAAGPVSIPLSGLSTLSRSASLNLLICGENETNNVAPTVFEVCVVNTADAVGTTNDPYLSLVIGTGWQFVGVSNVVEVTTTSHALVTTGISGLATGDLLVACISSRIASTTSITLPTGGEWTLVTEQKNNNTATNTSATPSGLMAYCVRGASDPNLTFTHPTAPSVAIGRIVAYRNVNSASPLDTQTSFTTATNVTAVSGTGLTTTQDDDLIVAAACGGQEATWTAFAAATDPTTSSGTGSGATADPSPNAWQERADSNTTTGADTSLAIFDAVKTATGATGNLTATASQGAAHVVVAGAFKLVAGSTNKTLAAGGGSYTLTGTAATPKVARKTVAGAGSYALTGTAATLRRNLPLVAGAGSYAITGTAASLLHKWRLTAGAGSYALTGTDATLKKGLTLSAGAGSYAITGTNASLLHGWKVAAGAGSYALTGTNATLRRNLPLIAGAGAYNITGTAASLFHNWKLAAGAGSYALTGTTASLLHGWKIAAGSGSYILTGANAALTITTANNKTLAAGAGSYAITGTAASLVHAWKLAAGSGSYALSGTAASPLHQWRITAGAGSYAITGTAAGLLHGWRVTAGAGSYTLTGSAATLRRNLPLSAGVGSYAISGTAASLLHKYLLSAGVGSYALTGTAATLRTAYTIAAGAGAYAFTGTAATLRRAYVLAAGGGAYVITGTNATLIKQGAVRLDAGTGSYLLSGTPVNLDYTATPSTKPPEVWWPVTPHRRKKETDEERRARVFAEMADDLENIQPDAKAAEIKRQVARIEKAARKVAEDAADERFGEFLIALRNMRQQHAVESIAAQQRIALEYARAIEASLRRSEEDAVLALLLAL